MTERRHRLWVVDDVGLELEASRQALAPSYDVELFSDGSSVLESAASGRDLPDVLVLDWHMQGVGGLDVVQFLRANDRTEGLPILVFTSTGDSSDLLEALSAGADDYVGKGSTTAELRARVGTLIRAKGLRERAERAERELAILLEREREARAEAEAANQAKDQFLATVSHELRTPLNAILGWARILGMGGVDAEKLRRAVTVIERNARAQAQIIDDLLDVSRIVSGKLRLELARVDVADAVEQAVESVRPAATARSITIAVDLDRTCAIAGDSARLQQIAWNLLTNAVKFTPTGGRISVRLACGPQDVTLTVADTGPGISPHLLPHVFDRFRQGDSATTRSHGGLGLGLAIVRQLVELHGGRASAANVSAGTGAVFEVTIPSIPSLAHLSPARRRVAAPMDALVGRTVLLVDDEADARDLVCELLGSYGATVWPVDSAREALALLDQQVPDVILSDIAMPYQDGYTLMRAIRSRVPTGVPAVALTALAREEDVAASRAAGFQAHVAKPIEADELVRTIMNLCGPPRAGRGGSEP